MVSGQDFPRAHWMLDDASPHADYSGYEANATNPDSTAAVYGPALVKGAERSLIISSTNKLTVDSPVLIQGKEYLPFAIETYVRPVLQNGEQQIVGNDGVMDGITINGTVVSFVTKYTNTGEARASFDTVDPMNYGIVGVHSKMKNQLYINGEMVAEVDITDAQQADTYVSPGGTLTCGSGNGSFMMNSLTLYDLELDDDAIATHYAHSQDTLGAEDVSISYKGALLEFSTGGAISPFYTTEFSSTDEWNLGYKVDVTIHDGTLYPVSSQGVSIPGYWEVVLPLGTMENSIYAANLMWEGTGATVSTSLDGATYATAQKGKALSTLTKGMSPENQFLFVRVSFPGGLVADESYFDNMVFSVYGTGALPDFAGREITIDNATPEGDYDVIDMHGNWGIELENGTVTIKAPVADTAAYSKTIEVWVNPKTTVTDNLSGADVIYSNGGSVKALSPGEWQLRHYVFNNGFTGNITFSGTGQIGHIMIYPDAWSASVIKEIYDAYTGKPRVLVDVDEVFDIHEFDGLVDIYEYDWSIESAG